VNCTAEHLNLLLIDPEGDVTGRFVAGIPGAMLVPGKGHAGDIQEKGQGQHRRRGQDGRSRSHNCPRPRRPGQYCRRSRCRRRCRPPRPPRRRRRCRRRCRRRRRYQVLARTPV